MVTRESAALTVAPDAGGMVGKSQGEDGLK